MRRWGVGGGWRPPAETVVRNVMLIANGGTGCNWRAGHHDRWRGGAAATTGSVSDGRSVSGDPNSKLLEGRDNRWWFFLEYYVNRRGYTIASSAGWSRRRWRTLRRLDLVVWTAAWNPGRLGVAGTAATAASPAPKIMLRLLLLLLLLLLAAFGSAILEPNLKYVTLQGWAKGHI